MKMPAYKASWGGLARMAFWWVLFLWLFGLALPQAAEAPPFAENFKASRILPMLAANGDKRLVREDAGKAEGATVAWIGDSTTMLFPRDKTIAATYIDEIKSLVSNVSARLAAEQGWKNHRIEYFALTGMKPVGALASAAAAIKRKPDVIVVTLNPVWINSSFEVFDHKSMGAAALLWLQYPRAWPLVAAMAAPHQRLSAWLGAGLPVLRESFIFRPLVTAQLPQPRISKAPAREQTPTVRNNPATSWLLGLVQRNFSGQMRDDHVYRSLLQEGAQNAGVINPYAINALLAMLKQSGIPAIVYVAPMAPFIYEDDAAKAGLEKARAHMETLEKQYGGGTLRIVAGLPDDVQRSLDFRAEDGLHLKKPSDSMSAYFAREIVSMKGKK